MIVGYQPGGTIEDARVLLRPDELLPVSYNTLRAAVYRETSEQGIWTSVKAKGVVLPPDSPLLTVPEPPPVVDVKDLVTPVEKGDFEHVDIIRFDD